MPIIRIDRVVPISENGLQLYFDNRDTSAALNMFRNNEEVKEVAPKSMINR